MSGTIYLLRDGGSVEPLAEMPYESEKLLQRLLAEYPDLLAGAQMIDGSPRRWLLIAKEAQIAVGDESAVCLVDHLFLDQEGIPTLVEVKRSSDARIRREVVGQMLDYAAGLAQSWPVSRLRACFDVDAGMQERLADLLDGRDPEGFWAEVESNLDRGRIRMVFVAGQIPPELRKIVDFLARQMSSAQVFAVEVRNFRGTTGRVLVPRLVSAPHSPPAPSSSRQWDEQSFFEELRRRRPQDVDAARWIFEWARKELTDFWYGKGAELGSCFPRLRVGSSKLLLFGMWTSGAIEMQFQHMGLPPFDAVESRLELIRRLNQIGQVRIPEDAHSRRPSYPISLISSEPEMKLFLDTMTWVIEQVRLKAAPQV